MAEEAGRKTSQLERQLRERGTGGRELEELRAASQSQEQRVAQSHREAQQSQAELASLEAILALLHLREVESDTYGTLNHTVGSFPVSHGSYKSRTVFVPEGLLHHMCICATEALFSPCGKQTQLFITDPV